MFFLLLLRNTFSLNLIGFINPKVLYADDTNVSAIPTNYIRKCTILEKIPSINLVSGIKNSDIDVSISNKHPQRYYLLSIFQNIGKTAIISPNIAGIYHISETDEENSVPIENTELAVLSNFTRPYYIYTNYGTPAVCNAKRIKPLHVIILTLSAIVCVSIIYIKTFTLVGRSKFLIFSKNQKDLCDCMNAELHPITKTFILKIFNSIKSGGIAINSTVPRMIRESNNIIFERLATMNIGNDLYLALVWEESGGNPEEPDIDVDIQIDNHKISGKPVVHMDSFRGFRPIHIDFTLSHHVHVSVDLPVSIIAPFQAFGQLVTNTMILMESISRLLQEAPFQRSNFLMIIETLCKQVSASHGICVTKDGQIVAQYTAGNVRPFTKEEAVIIAEKGANCGERPQMVLPDGSIGYIATLAATNDQFVFAIGFEKELTNKVFGLVGIPIMMLSCSFVFQLSIAKERSLRLNHFLNLMSSSRNFVFDESTVDGQTITLRSSFGQTRKGSTFIYEIFKTEEDRAHFLEEMERVKNGNHVMRQFSAQTGEEDRWVSASAISMYDEVIGKNVVTLIVEEITAIKQQETALINALADLDLAVRTLGVFKFHIKASNIILEDRNFFKELDVNPPDDLSLIQYVHPLDKMKVAQLRNSGKVIFRVMRGKTPIFYSAVTNGNVGFLFCVNDLIEVRTKTEEIAPTTVLTMNLIIWTVDATTEMVGSFFGQPTIWEVLSVDRKTEFSRMVNFIHEDEREIFVSKYSQLLKGTQTVVSDEFRILRIGGQYEWHRIIFKRGTKLIYCIAVNTHEVHEREEALKKQYNIKDDLFMSAKMMLWRFEPTHAAQKLPAVRLLPGLRSTFVMNWWYIEKYAEHPELVKDLIESVMDKGGSFSIIVKLKFKKPTTVLIQGEALSVSNKAIGIVTDITKLFDSAGINYESSAADRKVKDDSIHNYLCDFNDLFGAIDIIQLSADTRQISLLMNIIAHCSSTLLKYFKSSSTIKEESNKRLRISTNSSQPQFGGASMPSSRISSPSPSLVTGDRSTRIKGYDILDILETILSPAYRMMSDRNIEMTMRVVSEFPRAAMTDHLTVCAAALISVGMAIMQSPPSVDVVLEYRGGDITMTTEFKGTLHPGVYSSLLSSPTASLEVSSNDGNSKILARVGTEDVDFLRKDMPQTKALILTSRDYIRQQLSYALPENNVSIEFKPSEGTKYDFVFVDDTDEKIDAISDKCNEDGSTIVLVTNEEIEGVACIHPPLIICQTRRVVFQRVLNEYSTPFKPMHPEFLRRHVLVVEDNRTNQFVMAKILDTLGCTHQITESGEEAIAMLDEETFDIILIDYGLPGLDGIAATRIIRKSPKWYAGIPIVAVSAVESIKEECLKAGMNAFYAKPIRINDIREALTRVYVT